ncbi:MAG: hypothetical protein FWB75_09535, partial [Oscillospiraceae bacterium]|nr:hypothetical protein [Oscillospiraceae bacterium]
IYFFLSASDAFSITHFDEFVCFFILLMVFPQSLYRIEIYISLRRTSFAKLKAAAFCAYDIMIAAQSLYRIEIYISLRRTGFAKLKATAFCAYDIMIAAQSLYRIEIYIITAHKFCKT